MFLLAYLTSSHCEDTRKVRNLTLGEPQYEFRKNGFMSADIGIRNSPTKAY